MRAGVPELLKVRADAFATRHPHVVGDVDEARIIRGVLMKPEFECFTGELHAQVEALARSYAAALGPG